MNIILAQHTNTDWNTLGRLQGQTDIGLSEQGESEAEQLAINLTAFDIDLIISSDLKRASETAEIINKYLKSPLRLDKRLRECSFGKLEGMTKQQAIDSYGKAVIKSWDDQYLFYDFKPYNGENRDEVFNRHLEVLEALVYEKSNQTILLMGHSRGLATLCYGLGYQSTLKQGEFQLMEFGKKENTYK